MINGDDYFAIDSGYAEQATGYVHGDFDGNGRVNADDYFIIDSHYAKGSTPLNASLALQRSAPAVAVPSKVGSLSLFSDTTISSAYDRLQETDELL